MKSSKCNSQLWNDFDSESYRQPDAENSEPTPLGRLAGAVNRNIQTNALNLFVITAEFKHLPRPV
jgi:hypothetical protein